MRTISTRPRHITISNDARYLTIGQVHKRSACPGSQQVSYWLGSMLFSGPQHFAR